MNEPQNPTTKLLDPLTEAIAKEFYRRSLQRDGLTDAVKSWDEQWEVAKQLYAELPDHYIRPAHAIDDAREAVAIVRQWDAGK